MLTRYIERAMARACVEQMEDGRYFARLEDFQGPWAEGETPEDALKELREVFEEWLVLALRDDANLPKLEGISLNFGGKRWRKRSAAAS